ncbi:hypothetical protein C7441_104161 [Pseudaminobacter salicylatoxidans]|uniref:Uncharacterized protein n=1 Tax=Pseudaminobacter salicylatoxidans TaxID=93369 RepID=A0A316C6E3_PSESE|nr:hypothetical protein [Pseudaminobacter salicylatoxidans]PWJ84893.1 hypothetical protein C7441_104161 [Pseudaminobacter salicylatoxidans]
MINQAKILMFLKGEWSALSLFDKFQLCLGCAGLCWGAWAISPELETLREIRDRLGPAVQAADIVYVSKASRDGEDIAIQLQKARSENPLEYELWMCAGDGGKDLIFFGSGHFGREENSLTLRNTISENPSQVLLKVNADDQAYARFEEWDVFRSVKETETRILQGDVNCGEI